MSQELDIQVKADHKTIHTPENTPMHDDVEPKLSSLGSVSEEEAQNGYLSFFLGSDKKSVLFSEEAVSVWLNAQAAEQMVREEEITEAEANARRALWDEFAEKNYPDADPDQLNTYFRKLLNFHQQLFDDILVRSGAVREEGITNQSARGGGLITHDIFGKKPADKRKLAINEVMRRAAVRNNNTAYNFDTLLRNSFTRITVKKPELMQLGDLIRDIAEEVKGYVRQVGKNSPTIANMAAIRVIWRFISKNIETCSVKDTTNFADLASTIRITDVGPMCLDLVSAMYGNGVVTELNCLSSKCRHRSYERLDPKSLLHIRKKHQTTEESAVYGNIMNGTRSYSREEIEKLVAKIDFGTDGPIQVYSKNRTFYFELRTPTLQQAFDTFDYFISEINPRIQQLQATIADSKVYERELNVLLSQIAASEFMHWIGKFVTVPPADSDEKEMVLDRNNPEVDPYEFNRGIMSVLNDDEELSKELIRVIYNKSPYLSKTFCAISDHECKGCGERQSEIAKEQGRPTSYTPFNPVMHFFILAQLTMVKQATGMVSATTQALSD